MTGYQWPEGITANRRRDIATVIHVIRDSGPIENGSGRATGQLMDLLEQQGLELAGPYLSKTLADLGPDGVFGHFIDRKINGKRTHLIKIHPGHPPFPPRPEFMNEPEPEPEQEELEDEVGALEDPMLDFEGLDDDQLTVASTGVAIEAVPDASRVDKLLYVISMLNEVINDELVRPQVDFQSQMNAQLTAVNAIIEENQRLKKENDDLREDKRKLAAALQQSNQVMRGRAVQATRNGQPESVPA